MLQRRPSGTCVTSEVATRSGPPPSRRGVQNAVAQLAAHQAHNELAQEFLASC